jgi:hypothetical protein
MWIWFADCHLVTQHWYQSWWFDKEFERPLVLKFFLTKMVRQWVGESRRAAATTVQVYGWKSFRLRGYRELNDSHLRGRLLWQVWGELSSTLLRKLKVWHFICVRNHKPNVLRFWVKMWCLTHLIIIVKTNVYYPRLSSRNPTRYRFVIPHKLM